MSSTSPVIEVLRPGVAEVVVGRHKAKVLSVQIGSNNQVVYEVVWWEGVARKTEWVYPCEIVADTLTTVPIGFVSGGAPAPRVVSSISEEDAQRALATLKTEPRAITRADLRKISDELVTDITSLKQVAQSQEYK